MDLKTNFKNRIASKAKNIRYKEEIIYFTYKGVDFGVERYRNPWDMSRPFNVLPIRNYDIPKKDYVKANKMGKEEIEDVLNEPMYKPKEIRDYTKQLRDKSKKLPKKTMKLEDFIELTK